jgi:hypothetical protein
MEQNAEVENDDRDDKGFEEKKEFALSKEISLAGFVDQLGNLAHGAMRGQALEVAVNIQAEKHAKQAENNTDEEQRVAIGSEESALREIGQAQVGLTGERLGGFPA